MKFVRLAKNTALMETVVRCRLEVTEKIISTETEIMSNAWVTKFQCQIPVVNERKYYFEVRVWKTYPPSPNTHSLVAFFQRRIRRCVWEIRTVRFITIWNAVTCLICDSLSSSYVAICLRLPLLPQFYAISTSFAFPRRSSLAILRTVTGACIYWHCNSRHGESAPFFLYGEQTIGSSLWIAVTAQANDEK